MGADTSSQAPLAALETLFSPTDASPGDRPASAAVRERPDPSPHSAEPPRGSLENPPAGPSHPSLTKRVWDDLRDDDRAQKDGARVTVTISVTAEQRKRLKQMALDQDTTIQKLLEPSVLAVLMGGVR